MWPHKLLAVIATALLVVGATSQQLYFNNPIHPQNFWVAVDLSIFHLDSHYYFLITSTRMADPHQQIWISKSEILTNFRNATEKIFHPIPPSGERSQLFMGKMHLIDGGLYLYFTRFENGKPTIMYGMKAQNSSDPMGEWDTPIPVLEDGNINQGGIVMNHGNSNYLVFIRLFPSEGFIGGIFIQKLVTPTETEGPVVMIRNATEEWECQLMCTNEAPSFIYNGNISHMIFSVNDKYSPSRALARMSIPFEKDPMDPGNWELGSGPVFERNEEESVLMPGFASFTDSPDGTETWMMYQALDSPSRIISTARVEKISWNPDGSPKFPKAHGFNSSQPVPSGQTYT